jgi:hypothetical protein
MCSFVQNFIMDLGFVFLIDFVSDFLFMLYWIENYVLLDLNILWHVRTY